MIDEVILHLLNAILQRRKKWMMDEKYTVGMLQYIRLKIITKKNSVFLTLFPSTFVNVPVSLYNCSYTDIRPILR